MPAPAGGRSAGAWGQPAGSGNAAGRGRRLLRNIGSGILAQAWTAGLGLVTVPVLVHALGTAAYGLLGLALAVVGIGSLFDLGIGRSLAKYVAEDRMRADDYLASGFGLALAVSGGLVALVAPAVPWIAGHLTAVAALRPAQARWGIWLTLLGVPAVILRLVFEGALVGYERIDLTSWIRIATNTLKAGASIAAALLWHALLPVVAAIVAVSYCSVAALYAYGTREKPTSGWIVPGWRPAAGRQLARLGGLAAVCLAFGYLFLYADRWLILGLLSATALGYYTVSFDLGIRLTVISNSISQSYLPVFSAQSVRSAELGGSYFEANRLNAIAATGPALLLAVFSHPVLAAWVGADIARRAATCLDLLVLGVLAMCYVNIPYTLIFAAEARPQVYVGLYLGGLATHITVSVFLLRHFGFTGVAAGFCSGYCFVLFASWIYLQRSHPDWGWAPVVRAHGGALLAALPLAALGWLVQRVWAPGVAPSIVLLLALVVAYFSAAAMVGFNPSERQRALGLLGSVLKSAA